MRKLAELQIFLSCIIVSLFLWGMQQDTFTLAEGIAGFVFGMAGFIDAGIRLILED